MPKWRITQSHVLVDTFECEAASAEEAKTIVANATTDDPRWYWDTDAQFTGQTVEEITEDPHA